jgi:hypothetical protein
MAEHASNKSLSPEKFVSSASIACPSSSERSAKVGSHSQMLREGAVKFDKSGEYVDVFQAK